MTPKYTALIFCLVLSHALAWEALPQIPTGRRSQYLVLHENGGYKYGYDTGDGSAAKQAGDAANQVSGHYFYKNSAGQDVDLKYTAGVQGFVPENLEKLLPTPIASVPVVPAVVTQYAAAEGGQDDQANTGDASYNFNIDTDTYKRQESSDSRGNVKGSYSYTNAAGHHDLSYVAGENTGFVATSGSLARANGLSEGQASTYAATQPAAPQGYSYPAPASNVVNQINADGTYAFSYATGDSSRQESADAANNVQGRYSYSNSAGSHDLSYVAGAQTGFQVTGGSLAKPLEGATPAVSTYSAVPAVVTSTVAEPSGDGSYSFGYSAPDHSRQESADAAGNVRGSYSFKNLAGSHDLSYVAGSGTGFVVTGGSLAVPAAPIPVVPVTAYSVPVAATDGASEDDQANTGDSSYSFSIDTDEYKRQESADPSGNVRGSFSYKNAAGSHDLSYVAGAETGFVPTGGSLSNPEALAKIAASPVVPVPEVAGGTGVVVAKTAASEDSGDDEADSGDSSYNFSIDTDEYKRQESSDAQGNVRGSFSYKNQAGTHDLSYVAGSGTGFVATGGSLSDPNAITAKIAALPYNTQSAPAPVVPGVRSGAAEEETSGDATYNFSIDTDEYKRHESSDASGNVQGSFSYKNSAGSHDLSFVAGSATGFQPTGGSLSAAPGLTETQLRSGQVIGTAPVVQTYSVVQPVVPVVVSNSIVPSTKSSYKLGGNLVVHSYLPPSNEKKKYGYIFDTV